MFFVSFAVCFAISVAVTVFRERLENKRMEEALERLREKESTMKADNLEQAEYHKNQHRKAEYHKDLTNLIKYCFPLFHLITAPPSPIRL